MSTRVKANIGSGFAVFCSQLLAEVSSIIIKMVMVLSSMIFNFFVHFNAILGTFFTPFLGHLRFPVDWMHKKKKNRSLSKRGGEGLTESEISFTVHVHIHLHLHHSRLIRKGVNQFTCYLKRCDPITPYLKRCEHIHTLSKKV